MFPHSCRQWCITSAILLVVIVGILLGWPSFFRGEVTAVPLLPDALLLPRTITNSIEMKLMMIPPGEFQMGSDKEEGRFFHEGPRHRVLIDKRFYMGTYEVTQGQYHKVMGENPARHKLGADYPVEQVTWEEAVQFCVKLSELPAEKAAGRVYRLPTEAEWEFACRAGTCTPFSFGDALTAKQANFDRAQETSAKVGSGEPNAFGLYDMHGNVWEWCADWFDANAYPKTDRADPTGPDEGGARVIRGGSWHTPASQCRSASRESFSPNHRFNDIGFRVVCTFGAP